MSVVERVHELITPILADLGLDLYDLDHAGGVLRVVVDRPGGVDMTAIADATRLISRELDHADPDPRAVPARGHQPRPRAHPPHARALPRRRRERHQGPHARPRGGRAARRGHPERSRRRRHHDHHRRRAASPARAGSPTPTSNGPGRSSSGSRRRSPAKVAPRRPPPAPARTGRQSHEQHRHDRSGPAPRRREGHLGRDPAPGAGRRPGVGLQAPSRCCRRGRGPDRRRHDGHPHHRLRPRRGGQLGQPARRHPERPRPHRRPDLPAGDEPAHPRGRA